MRFSWGINLSLFSIILHASKCKETLLTVLLIQVPSMHVMLPFYSNTEPNTIIDLHFHTELYCLAHAKLHIQCRSTCQSSWLHEMHRHFSYMWLLWCLDYTWALMAVNLELEIIEGASIEVINSKTIESKTQHKYTMESTNFINPRAFSSVLTALVSYSLGPTGL